MIIDEFKLVKNNKFVEITSNRKFIYKDCKILFNIEHMRNNEFEEDLKKWEKANPGVLEMYFKMKKWLKDNHPEIII